MLAYVIAPQMTRPQAMGLVVVEGLVITILVLTGFREAVFRAVPPTLRIAISVGIGLFITLVGLADAGIVRAAARWFSCVTGRCWSAGRSSSSSPPSSSSRCCT